jgi:hypothetical protein
VVREEDGKWPGGPSLELERPRTHGVSAVRLSVDRGIWEVEVRVGRRWYEPFWALRVVAELPDQSRAFSHEERRAFTLEAARTIRGTVEERRRLRRRQKEYEHAYTQWAMGKGPHP